MRETPWRIGILGAGSISAYHIEGLQAAGAEVTAISSPTLAHAESTAQRWHFPFATDDNSVLLARTDVDAVVIATPDWTHYPLACSALAAGKPALVQKPMAERSADCRAMILKSPETGVPLAVSFMHRHFPEV
jgi:predicted dehydrogenase